MTIIFDMPYISMRSWGSPPAKYLSSTGKPSRQLHRLTAATVTSQLLVGHGKGGRQDGEELVERVEAQPITQLELSLAQALHMLVPAEVWNRHVGTPGCPMTSQIRVKEE
jgi:hypothetical protein